jgi:biofilm PGA synthesis N-glycosyltransferase PgaC
VQALLLTIRQSLPYEWALVFFATYPIVTSIMWISTAMLFRWRWEPAAASPPTRSTAWPFVSVLVPAHNEQAVIGDTVAAVLRLDYADFELIVIDDGSSDATLATLAPLRADPRLRVVHKTRNEGKALALNDALPLARGEIVMCLDADAEPDPALLRWLVPHFDSPRVAAVTGNPRVVNTGSFVARLQAIEFSSIISLMRRAQRIWGRIVTVSGVVAAFRKSALLDVGGFAPAMPTEDIDMTWKLQKRFYDVRYEPRALCWMTVPLTLRGLFRQRLRWARGLMRVLRQHADVAVHWRMRRLWPVFVESWLSILWALCFVVLTALWCLSAAFGLPLFGATPIPNLWGMAIASFCLLQLLTGVLIDRRYDADIVRLLPYAVWYPVAYWAFLTVTTVLALPYLWRQPDAEPVRWQTQRQGRAS